MAEQPEQSQERSEAATPRRKQQAREKGQVPRSRELNTMMVVVAGSAMLLLSGQPMGSRLATVLARPWQIERQALENPEFLLLQLGDSLLQAFLSLWPVWAVLLLAAMAGPVSLGGFNFSTEAMRFKPDKLNPVSGLKRLFSLQALMELLKTVLKFVFVTGLAVWILWWFSAELLQLGQGDVRMEVVHGFQLLALAFFLLSLVLIVLALLDVPWQLWQYNRQLRMTRQEVKDEMKDTEGKPEVKGRIRQLQQQLAMQRMMQDVEKADVVVTNPTHYAVALKYEEDDGAPRVLAKGRGVIAAQIRERAQEHGILQFSAPPLARALYASCEIGDQIPAELFKAVAMVLAYVYQVQNLKRADRTRLKPPEDLPVPEDMVPPE